MSRIETIGNATLYLGDCREIMPTLQPVDAVVTDPPYGMNYGAITGGAKGRSKSAPSKLSRSVIGDDRPFDPAPLLKYPTVVLWGGNHFASRLPDSRCWLVWDKREGGRPDNQADCELAWTNLRGPARLHRQLWRGMVRRGEENISLGQERVHPTQKPAELMRWCIERCSPVSSILDPYMGSGTTGVACATLGITFFGIEIDPVHFDTACRRIEEAARQPNLFAEPSHHDAQIIREITGTSPQEA